MPNRLARETSPYLLQHADNPVDWYPWSEAAFIRARQEDKPILLSVGYSACHWCHVMAHESFEDAGTAALMNEHFINVKVDREERPDVDAIYMSAVQAMTGQGGWPMTVVMTPDGAPFFGGTYFPPQDRHGHPAFKRVLSNLAAAWFQKRDEVLESAKNAAQYLQSLASMSAQGELVASVLEQAQQNLERSFDPVHGGFGDAPKFPPHSSLRFLLNTPKADLAHMSLECMARGGIYDQIGGGFSRYSVDAKWLVPHFEKMLYDNAQLVQRYAEAYRLTAKPLYKQIIEETLAWVSREMTSDEGGFYSALDADSEGVEGKFYVWSALELDEILGEDADLAKAYYGVSEAGNFEGANILNVSLEPADILRDFGLEPEHFELKLTDIKANLFAARLERVRPGLDDKILTSWNGLMLSAYADAGRILERQDYLETARKNASFIRDKLYDGRLKHSYKAGEAKIDGLLEDYAYYALGLLALYQASFEEEWLELAFTLSEHILGHFRDPDGGFFSTSAEVDLIARPKNFFDSPNPSENAASAELLLKLSRLSDEHTWQDAAAVTIQSMSEAAASQPSGFGTLLVALQWYLAPRREIVIVGERSSGEVAAFLSEVQTHAAPFVSVVVVAEGSSLYKRLPMLQGKTKLGGETTAYVCEHGSCQLPVTTPKELREQLVALERSV